MTQTQTPVELVTKGQAWRRLKISRTKLDSLIEEYNIPLQHDPRDKRLRYVDLNALRRVLNKPGM